MLTLNNYIKNNKLIRYSYLNENDKAYIETKFKHIKNVKLTEALYMLYHNLSNRPICPVCGNEIILKRFSLGYQKFCSNKCRYSTTGKNKISYTYKQTCLEKYGVDNVMKIPEIKNKSVEHCKETNNINYNVDYNFQRPEIRNKIIETVKNKTGYNYAFLNKEKVKDTLHNKYGSNINNVFQLNTVKEQSIKTKYKNNSFNKSKFEDIAYNILSNYFKVIRQYKSEQYPFNCDFYLPDKNLYLEINASWTHGTHPFDEHNIEDVKLYEKWIQLSDYYKNAAYTWRYRDVKKRNIALENNLNYIEIFCSSINDLEQQLNKIIEIINNAKESNI